MWPRIQLDITWRDLLCGGFRCVWPGDISHHETNVLARFGGQEQALVCLSVRSGFDLLLQCLQLPAGSEVMISAITIPDMVRIIEYHGLTPVPFDLDFQTLAPTLKSLEQARTDRTKILIMAPLFGATIDLKPILLFAKKHNILVIEDCAQSFHGWYNLKPSNADVGLYSFGPIKTSTALGGAVVVTHDKSLASQLRFIHQNYPTQRRSAYARRVIKYFLLKLASTRSVYSLLFLLSKKMRVDADSAISRLAKNFGDGDLISKIRLRPSAALVAVLARRQRRYPRSRCDIRMEIGRRLREQICTNERNDQILIPGSQAAGHSYWVFPMKWRSTDRIRNRLRMNGFDVTSKHNLVLVRSIREITDIDTPNMQDLLDHILFLPVHPELPSWEADRLAELVVDCLNDSSTSEEKH